MTNSMSKTDFRRHSVLACIVTMALSSTLVPTPGLPAVEAQIVAPGSPTGRLLQPQPHSPAAAPTLDDRWPLMFTWRRNKVNWWDLQWQVTELPSTTLYYYAEAEPIARLAARMMVVNDSLLQAVFNYDLQQFTRDKTIPTVIYTSHHTFEQTNTIPQPIAEGLLGFTEFIKGRVVFPYQGNNQDFRHVLEHENTHIHMIHKLKHLYKEKGVNDLSRLLPTLWFSEGLAEYESIGRDPVTGEYRLDIETEMYVRDALLNDSFPTVREMRLYPDWRKAYKFGHALVQYLSAQRGPGHLHEMLSLWHHQYPNRNSYSLFRRRSDASWDPLNPGLALIDPPFINVAGTDYPVELTTTGWRARLDGTLIDSIAGRAVTDLASEAENIELGGTWYRLVETDAGRPAAYRPDTGLLFSFNGESIEENVHRARRQYEREAYRLLSFDRLMEWWFETTVADLTERWQADSRAYWEPWMEGRFRVRDLETIGDSAPELWPTISDDGRLVLSKTLHDELYFTIQVIDLESGRQIRLARENTPEIESIHILTEGGDIRHLGDNLYRVIYTAQLRDRDVVYAEDIERAPDGELHLRSRRKLIFDPEPYGIVALTGVRFTDSSSTIIFSGLGLDGYQDLYLADIDSGRLGRRLTHDLASDRMPVVHDGRVVFASDRASPPTTFAYHLFTLDLDTDELVQLTDGTGNELSPAFSPDGSQLFFQSDYTGVNNLYRWRPEGDPEPVTDVTLGAFTPAPVSSELLIFSGFDDEEYRLYLLPLTDLPNPGGQTPDPSVRSGSLPRSAIRLEAVNRTWEPERSATADILAAEGLESDTYRPAYSIDQFYAYSEFGGYRGYNASQFGTTVSFSDILGNHQLGAAVWDGPRSGITDLSWIASYWNQKNRIKMGAAVYRTDGIYYNWARQQFYFRERAGVTAQINLPFNQFSDLDLLAGVATERRHQGTILGSVEYDQFEFGIGYTRDLSTWSPQGPHKGWVFSAYYNYIFNTEGGLTTFNRYLLADLRGYFPLHRYIVAAGRVAGGHSTGLEPEIFFLGGGFFLRGFWNLYDMYGSSYTLYNTELRLQLLELMQIKPIRMFEQRGWPVQLVFFAEGAEARWDGEKVGPLGSRGTSLRLTLALPFVVEYAWYRKNPWSGGGERNRELLFTLLF